MLREKVSVLSVELRERSLAGVEQLIQLRRLLLDVGRGPRIAVDAFGDRAAGSDLLLDLLQLFAVTGPLFAGSVRCERSGGAEADQDGKGQ